MSKSAWSEPPRNKRIPPRLDSWKKTPAKKNTRKWCKGKVGVEHVLDIRLSSWAETWKKTCGWNKYFALRTGVPHYSCCHEQFCVDCGKIMWHSWDEKTLCPLWTEPPIVG